MTPPLDGAALSIQSKVSKSRPLESETVKMQTVVVLDKATREIIAEIPLANGEKAILRGDVDFEIRDSE